MSWKCSCGLLNNGLNSRCAATSQAIIQFHNEHKPISDNTEDDLVQFVNMRQHRRAIAEIRRTNEALLKMENSQRDPTKDELDYIRWYNEAAELTKDMDIIALREHIQELEVLCRKGRTYLKQATDENARRSAKLKSEQKSWLSPVTDYEPSVSDAIQTVKKRKERMSKLEKTQAAMKALGISDEAVKDWSRTVGKTVTDDNLQSINQFKAKGIDDIETLDNQTQELIEKVKNEIESQKKDVTLTDKFKF